MAQYLLFMGTHEQLAHPGDRVPVQGVGEVGFPAANGTGFLLGDD